MKVCTFLADRFETVEALAVVDVLRRAGITVDLVSISDSKTVTSAQSVTVHADYILSEYDASDADVIFLPGGPGHVHLEESKEVVDALKKQFDSNKRIAAICAAPSILGHLGMLQGKKATCFPGYENDLKGAEVFTAPTAVVTDGNITTARGMGKTVEFGLELVKILLGEEKAEEISTKIQFK